MSASVEFRLVEAAPDERALRERLADESCGAVLVFDGRVREHNEGAEVESLEYQAHPPLALRVGREILEQEARHHGLRRVLALHRTGALAVGECAVWLGVAAAQRGAVFEGGRAIMERLKYELPVWKKERYRDGREAWVGPDGHSPEREAEREADESPCWQAVVERIFISPGHDFRGRHGEGRLEHGSVALEEVECVAGLGLRGDRYFGHKPDFKGQVTFFDGAVVEAVRERFGLAGLDPAVFRRNVIVRGVDLSQWVGRRFRLQGMSFEGSEECRPCYWMDEVAAGGVEEFLRGGCRGGLRARILRGGVLRVGG